jgi:hypothetical protein
MLKRICRVVAPAALLALAVSAYAEDAAPQPQPFVRASIASTDRVKQAVADLGIPLPIDVAGMIEQQFNFVGQGGIDPTKPVGVIFVAGEGLTPQQMTMFALPVKAGKATVESFTAMGGKAVEGQADSVQLGGDEGGVTFRRTADYLMFYSGAPSVVKMIENAPFAKDYSSPDTLAHVEIDAALARKVAPKMYKGFVDSIRDKANASAKPTASAAEARGQQIGQEFAIGLFEKVDKLTLTVGMGKDDLRIASTVTPTPMKGSRTFAKPNFNAASIVTGHVAYPDADATQWLTRLVKTAIAADKEKSDKLTPEQTQAIEAMSSAIVGDAQSFAVEANNGKMQITIVNQYERDVNLPDVLKKSIPVMEAMDADKGVKPELTISDADGPDGSKGIRITKPAKAGEPSNVTVLQKGKLAVIRLSEEELPPAPITLSPTEKISELMTMNLHLVPAMQAAAAMPNSPLSAMPEEKRKELMTRLTGKDVKIGVSNTASGALAVNLDVPVELLKIGSEVLLMAAPMKEAEPAAPAPMNP